MPWELQRRRAQERKEKAIRYWEALKLEASLNMHAVNKIFCIVKNKQKSEETNLSLLNHILFVQVSFLPLTPKSVAS